MRSDFAVNGDDGESGDVKEQEVKDGDEEDHKNFFKKMQ